MSPNRSRPTKPALSKEMRSQIVLVVLAAMLGALFGSIGTLWTERRNSAEELESKRSEIVLRVEERSAETAAILGKMIDTADLALKSRARGSTTGDVASVSQEFTKFHLQLQDRAWRWPGYVVEEARTHLVLAEPDLKQLNHAALGYVENLKKEVELAWTLHAFCKVPMPEAGRVADIKSRLQKAQAGERESLDAMKTVLRQR